MRAFLLCILFVSVESQDVNFQVSTWRDAVQSSITINCGPKNTGRKNLKSSAVSVYLYHNKTATEQEAHYHPWFVVMWVKDVILKNLEPGNKYMPIINTIFDRTYQSLNLHLRVPQDVRAKLTCVIDRVAKPLGTVTKYVWFPHVTKIFLLKVQENGDAVKVDDDMFDVGDKVRALCLIDLGSPPSSETVTLKGPGGKRYPMSVTSNPEEKKSRNVSIDFNVTKKDDGTTVTCGIEGIKGEKRVLIKQKPQITEFSSADSIDVYIGSEITCKASGRPVPNVTIQGVNSTHVLWYRYGSKERQYSASGGAHSSWAKGNVSVRVPEDLQTGTYILRCLANNSLGYEELRREFNLTLESPEVIKMRLAKIMLSAIVIAILLLLILVLLICYCIYFCCILRPRRRKRKRPRPPKTAPPPPPVLLHPILSLPAKPSKPPPPPPVYEDAHKSLIPEIPPEPPLPRAFASVTRSPRPLPSTDAPEKRVVVLNKPDKPAPLPKITTPVGPPPKVNLIRDPQGVPKPSASTAKSEIANVASSDINSRNNQDGNPLPTDTKPLSPVTIPNALPSSAPPEKPPLPKYPENPTRVPPEIPIRTTPEVPTTPSPAILEIPTMPALRGPDVSRSHNQRNPSVVPPALDRRNRRR